MVSTPSEQSRRLEGRIALITGASRGIGRSIALRIAAEGAHCVLVAKTTGGLEEVDDEIKALGGTATLVPMDLTDYPAIDRLGAGILDRYGKLDIFVGNAGILGKLTPVGHIQPEIWDKVIAVNLTANWRLIRSLDPLLRASDAGRVVMLTSSVGNQPRAYWGAYAVSKAGLENLALTYAAELEKTPVCVNLLNPGATRTRMREEAYPGENPETLKSPDVVADAVLDLVLPENTQNGQRISL
ncbi:MAG: SDR family NAD(P)-dependent oxidoreductase [Rhodospirillales bacterium]|nr:SDR family NAD(P)-dependent oxidoreductase [Rhodospirillales bacterium]MBT4038921.1 SDR family NAD(P)-dependent oxidoreductase [Rhodospirillales bacterium]MBT4625569.1 SDR family NAD(P)-dependent oxidoreductase [Rhodospirillales bacterium]MBT5352274.1 SDR family NAD(P)-dependent oxidoreductase [Rhodospirillales bacterium]MBT5521261.1 SDR family NAD(P)-dependent oxidoreductase [Rhodospirillales bacterium]